MAAARKVIDLSVILCFIAGLPRFKRTHHLIISGCIVLASSHPLRLLRCCVSQLVNFDRMVLLVRERCACSFSRLTDFTVQRQTERTRFHGVVFSGQCPATEFHVGGHFLEF